MKNKLKMSLVGYSGFVGSNLASSSNFDGLYNSKNVTDAFGTNPDILIYAGLRAEKYIANKYPERDLNSIHNAIKNIKLINPQKLVLISTIDVYNHPNEVNELSIINKNELSPYGLNRLLLEEWVEQEFENYCILRLPGLFGKNIKKNFIYDMINKIPFKLNEQKFYELSSINPSIKMYYTLKNDGFYTIQQLTESEKNNLLDILTKVNFSSLNFTDSRGVFQFYNLAYLWEHIQVCLRNNIKKINIAIEPISIEELYRFVVKQDFKNECIQNPPYYNFKTIHDHIFCGQDGYIFKKNQILEEIKRFIENYSDENNYKNQKINQ